MDWQGSFPFVKTEWWPGQLQPMPGILAFYTLCDGTCLQDLELRRQDEVYLDALGAARIANPDTAGDFCRHFTTADVPTLIDVVNDVRQRVWARQCPSARKVDSLGNGVQDIPQSLPADALPAGTHRPPLSRRRE